MVLLGWIVTSLGCEGCIDDPWSASDAPFADPDDVDGLMSERSGANVPAACLAAPGPASCCTFSTGETLVTGTPGPDSDPLSATSSSCVFGYEGDDDYQAGADADIMAGGEDDDRLAGGDGDDSLIGEGGDDTLIGEDGNDELFGGDGVDDLRGGKGADVLEGGDGFDVLHGGEGPDQLDGGAGDDLLVIYDECEVDPSGEQMNGGDGFDIVISPVEDPASLGIVMIDIEQVVVDTSRRHLAECGPPPPGSQDQYDEEARSLTMRREISLGCGRRIPGKYSAGCQDTGNSWSWAATEARDWIDVPHTTTKFLATHDDASAAITFTAHAAGNQIWTGMAVANEARSPIHLRALVDGEVLEPGDVTLVFPSDRSEPVSFTFAATEIPEGIHNVRFQWRIGDDPWNQFQGHDPVGRIHGANVSVSVDAPHTEVAGVARSSAAGQGFATNGQMGTATAWSPVKDPLLAGPLTVMAYVEPNATTTVNFSTEVSTSHFGTLEIRAKVDDDPDAFAVNDVRYGQRLIMARHGTTHPNADHPHGFNARSFTFLAEGLEEGWHKFTFDARLSVAGTERFAGEYDGTGIWGGSLYGRSASVVSSVDEPLVGIETKAVAEDGAIAQVPGNFAALGGLSQSVLVEDDAQVIVRLDADVRDLEDVTIRLTRDGSPVPGSERHFSSAVPRTGTLSADWVLKRLPGGQLHDFGIEWEGVDPSWGPIDVGARTLVVRTEPLHTPDLGRGIDVGSGAIGTTDYRRSVQALDGARKVLPVVIDPLRPSNARVTLTNVEDGSYDLKIKGLVFQYDAPQNDTAEDIGLGLIDLVNNAQNLHVTANTVAPGDWLCSSCDYEFQLVADQLGLAGLPDTDVFFTEKDGNDDPIMKVTHNVQVPFAVGGAYDDMLFGNFGGNANSKRFWLQQSRELLELEPAYEEDTGTASTRVVGPVNPEKTGIEAMETYWWRDYSDSCFDESPTTYPYRGGQSRRYWEGLAAADKTYPALDFSEFDVDQDGVIENEELLIVFITPQASGGFGSVRNFDPFCPQYLDPNEGGDPSNFQLDGVTFNITWIEWYGGDGTTGYMDHRLIAHEFGHAFGLDDQYVPGGCSKGGSTCTEHESWGASIMNYPASGNGTADADHWSELDGIFKLSYGWVTPRTIRHSQEVALEPVTSGREVLVLPREGSGGHEYFLVENRVERSDIDPAGGFDVELGDQGLAVWHVVEPEYAEHWAFDGGNPPLGCWEGQPNANDCSVMGSGQQCDDATKGPVYDFSDKDGSFTRRSLRMIRSGDYASRDGSGAMWNMTTGDVPNQGAVCGPGVLLWADGSASPYQLTDLDPAGGTMNLCVEVDGVACL